MGAGLTLDIRLLAAKHARTHLPDGIRVADVDAIRVGALKQGDEDGGEDEEHEAGWGEW